MNSQENLIDNDRIVDSKADISIDNGYNFGPATRIVAAALVIFGILAILSGGPGYFIGAVVLAASMFALFSKSGTDISLSNNYVREYAMWLGIKRGKWISTVMLPDIAVLRIGKTRSVAHASTGASGTDLDATTNEVYLLSANHRKRILVKTCKSKKEADVFATELAGKMGKNFVQFNPQISEKTKARR